MINTVDNLKKGLDLIDRLQEALNAERDRLAQRYAEKLTESREVRGGVRIVCPECEGRKDKICPYCNGDRFLWATQYVGEGDYSLDFDNPDSLYALW